MFNGMEELTLARSMTVVWGLNFMFSFSSVARWAVRLVAFSEAMWKFLYVMHFCHRTEEKTMFVINKGKFPIKLRKVHT